MDVQGCVARQWILAQLSSLTRDAEAVELCKFLLNGTQLSFVQQGSSNLERRLLNQLHLQCMQLLCMLLLHNFIATAQAVLLLF